MSQLLFHQIYPYQTMPVLAKDYKAPIPKRADAFCHPFKQASQAGVYAFSPLDFRFKLDKQEFVLEATTADGNLFSKRIKRGQNSNNNFVLLSDINPSRSRECLAKYRSRIPDEIVPASIDKHAFGFYEVLLNIMVEEDPFDCYIQMWLGGAISQQGAERLWVKHATNINQDPGFTCLDAEIDTKLWQGWFAILLKPTRINQWVEVTRQAPVCQLLSVQQPIETLTNQAFEQISQQAFSTPIQWHIFDCDYGIKPGKYQRQIRKK